MNFLKKNGGLLTMIFAALGVVVFANIFESLMTYFDAVWAVVGIEDLFLVPLMLKFGPTIILVVVIGGFAFAYMTGIGSVAASDANGLIRIIMAGLGLIMFIATFPDIAEIFVDLVGTYGDDPNYSMLGLALGMFPGIVLIEGIIGSVGSAVSGYRARRRKVAA
jgi:hypothetical protein